MAFLVLSCVMLHYLRARDGDICGLDLALHHKEINMSNTTTTGYSSTLRWSNYAASTPVKHEQPPRGPPRPVYILVLLRTCMPRPSDETKGKAKG